MSLKGSLDTFALPEVLGLLADTSKTGALHVKGPGVEGKIWFSDGSIAGYDVADSQEPFEAIFELLRLDEGVFRFNLDENRPASARVPGWNHNDVRSEIDLAEERLTEWREIVAAVPSMYHDARLVHDAPNDVVSLDRSQWSLVVAIGDGRPVHVVLSSLGLREFDGCKALRALVDLSLAEVVEPSPQPVPVAAEPEPRPAVVEAPVVAPVAEAPESVDLVADDEIDAPDPEPAVEAAPAFDFHSAYNREPQADVEPPDEEPVLVSAPEAAEDHEDHYAALRAAVLDVEELASSDPNWDAEAQDGDASVSPEDLATYTPAEPELSDGYTPAEAEVPDGYGSAEPEVPDVYGSAGTEVPANGSVVDPGAARHAALQALLQEVSSPPEPTGDEPVDGLKDRGPWTSSELEQMNGWRDDDAAVHPTHNGSAEHATATTPTPVATHDEAASEESGEPEDETAEEEPGEEPINRGLLLKFLSSVRN